YLLQRQLAAFVAQLPEPITAVAAVPHHLAGLADIAELRAQFQEPDLPSADLLFLGHAVLSVPAEGRAAVPARVRTAPRPPAPSPDPRSSSGSRAPSGHCASCGGGASTWPCCSSAARAEARGIPARKDLAFGPARLLRAAPDRAPPGPHLIMAPDALSRPSCV